MQASGPGESILRCENISKSFGATKVLDGLDIDVANGEFLTLLGPSGCGKSTALSIIAGILHQTSGRITLRGRDVSGMPPRRRNLGFVFQSWALFPHMTAFENVAYGLKARKVPTGEISSRVTKMLDLVRLSGASDRFPSQLSGGMQQRVALARALVTRPDLLLLDEPLSNLDATLRKEMQIEIRRIHSELNISTILVTHSQEEALVMSDRIAVMSNGKVEALASPQEIYNTPSTPFVCTFLGNANVLAGNVESIAGDTILVRVGPTRLLMRKPATATVGKTASFAIRPEAIQISANEGATEGNRISVIVQDRIFVGNHILLEVANGDLRLQIMAPPASVDGLMAGSRATVELPQQAIMVFEGRGE